jgi:chemotaxis signal transduction protein
VIPAVIFPIGDDHYAVAASSVREVVCEPRPTRLPTLAPSVLGAFNLRGEVVPLFDLAALLGVGTTLDAPFAVVVNTPTGSAGLAVGGLPLVVSLDEEIAPTELRGRLGVHAFGGRLAVLLDASELLTGGADVAGVPTGTATVVREMAGR